MKHSSFWTLYLGSLLLAVLTCSCDLDLPGEDGPRYQVPIQRDDGWEVASLEDVGMDPGPMIDLMRDLGDHPDHWVHSILVVKDGKLVFEEYFSGDDVDLSDLESGLTYVAKDFGWNSLHSANSVTKSVTSLLVGIALDGGLLGGTQSTMFSYFPDYAHLADATKERITLEHVLTMTTGLPWSEAYPYDDPRNDLVSMVLSNDPIGYVLGMPALAEPGTQFVYNSGTANLLGEIVRRASGRTLAQFAREHLFSPLGIESFEWYAFPHAPEMMVASSTLYLRPRDMAKIGQLCLDGGVWKGTRVVSQRWCSLSTREAVATVDSPVPSLDPGYGFLWWRGTFSTGRTPTYFAAGWGGQFIFALPDAQMVVVLTAGSWEREYDPLLAIVNEYVLPAAGR